MRRYDTRIDNGTLYVESPEEWLKVGPMEEICTLLGGETYTIEYDERAQTVGWLDTAPDGTITFDVHETLAGMSFDEEFVTNLATTPIDETDDDGYPHRTSFFAEMMATIWDSKGNLKDT